MWFEKEIKKEELQNKDRELFRAYVGFAYDKASYFGQYETAINIVINTIYETKTNSTIVCHPLLYMMRHSIELAIKMNNDLLSISSGLSNDSVKGKHNLEKLLNKMCAHYDKIVNTKSISCNIQKLFERDILVLRSLIGKLPKDDAAFRFPDKQNGELIFTNTSVVIDILDVLEEYRISVKMLSCLVDTIELDPQ